MHDTLGPVSIKVHQLSDYPDTQVAQTVGLMGQFISNAMRDPEFRAWAGSICGNGSDWDKIQRAYWHTKESMRFQRDELIAAGIQGLDSQDAIEVVIPPADTMRFIQRGVSVGDCDCFTTYLPALLLASGVDVKGVTVAANGDIPDQFSHIYSAAYVDGQRISLDASHGDYPGWEAHQMARVYRIREWDLSPQPLSTLFWVGALGAGAYLGWKGLAA